MPSDEDWIRVALAEADVAAVAGEVPVGCVAVGPDGIELARGHNLRETLADPTAHAEMIVLRAAAKQLSTWRLEGATVYVTLEPCVMCAGALVNARVARVVYGCDDPKGGGVVTLFQIPGGPCATSSARSVRGGFELSLASCARRERRADERSQLVCSHCAAS